MDNVNDFLGNAKKNIVALTPYGTERFFSSGSEFLNSNTLIAKATFLLLVIILFVFLFYVFSRIIIFLLTPPENPFILKGMKDATQSMTIPQTFADHK